MEAPFDNSPEKNFENSSRPTDGGGVIVDIGTGDGRFVYRLARENPHQFYIGIDANAAALKEISTKAARKPAKGGLNNVLFVQSAVENLPAELNDAADEIHIHFPWGSLLGAVATGDLAVLQNLRRIAAPDCLLEIIFGVDRERDRAEIERLNLPAFSAEYLQDFLIPRYRAAGFDALESGVLAAADWSKLETSWARKLQGNSNRQVVYFIAQAIS